MVNHADFYRTLAEILDIEVPNNAGEDSISTLYLWKGYDAQLREDTPIQLFLQQAT